MVHGLDPYAGYIHADKSGRPFLVLDLMEEFRPHVDLMIIKMRPGKDWLEGGVLKREARAAVGGQRPSWSRLSPSRWGAPWRIFTVRPTTSRTSYDLAGCLRH